MMMQSPINKLGVAAGVGLSATTFLTILSTKKTIEEANKYAGRQVDKKAIIKKLFPIYISAAISFAGTIACIVGMCKVSESVNKALSGACATLIGAKAAYEEEVKKRYGEEEHEDIIVSLSDLKDHKDIETFYDMASNRYFESTMANLLTAEYELNRLFVETGEVTLNDFYDFLGIERTTNGFDQGWSWYEGDNWIYFTHYISVTDDGLNVCVIDSSSWYHIE